MCNAPPRASFSFFQHKNFADVRFWHKADNPTASAFVRYDAEIRGDRASPFSVCSDGTRSLHRLFPLRKHPYSRELQH